MPPSPLFSIVTISFNQRKYLQQAIQSVLAQDSGLFEYLIMDGGSDDGSRSVIEDVANRLTFWQSCPDGGPSNALRDAVERCSGEFLVYINSDDMLLPGALSRLAEAVRQTSEADVVYGHGLTYDETKKTLKKVYSDRWTTKAYARGLVSIFQQSCAHRISVIKKAGNFNPENRTCWDGELLFRMGQIGARFHRVNDFYGVFRIHDDSITGSQQVSEEYVEFRNQLAKQAGEKTFLRGGLKASLLKSVRDPILMGRKLVDRVLRTDSASVDGFDLAKLTDGDCQR